MSLNKGRQLELQFSKDGEFVRSTFTLNESTAPIAFDPGDVGGNGRGPLALALFFVSYGLWAIVDSQSGDFTQTTKLKAKSPWNTLAVLIEKEVDWLYDAFGRDGKILKDIFKPRGGDNRSGKPHKGAQILRVQRAFLPPASVVILWNGKRLDNRGDFVGLRDAVYAKWKALEKDGKHWPPDWLETPAAPRKLPGRAPARSAVEEAWDIFEGKVEILTNDLLHRPASRARVLQYYTRGSLNWDIIAAKGDIPRDQADAVYKKVNKHRGGLRLVAIVAEAGAGKSTFAWRLAYRLYKDGKALVARFKDSTDPDPWYCLPEFMGKLGGRRLYILVDDVFRSDIAASAFRGLNPSLPVTVLATSRRNEWSDSRLPCDSLCVELAKPSSKERARLLRTLGKKRLDMPPDQRSRLDRADQFLVLMMELVEGKGLDDIIRDTILQLRELDEFAGRAYEYLSFAYQFSLATPTSLLERLEPDGNFHNLDVRRSTEGLIFPHDRPGHLRLGHPLIAEKAAACFGESHNPVVVLSDLIRAVDPGNEGDRLFLSLLLRVLGDSRSAILEDLAPAAWSKIRSVVENASRLIEMTQWRAFYNRRGTGDMIERCIEIAAGLTPVTSLDCSALVTFLDKSRDPRRSLPVLKEWMRAHPDDGNVRGVYLGIIDRIGTPAEVVSAIADSEEWIHSHRDDSYVRSALLGLIKRKGTSEDVSRILKAIRSWLPGHVQDATLRTAFLGLIQERVQPKRAVGDINETIKWLSRNRHDAAVRCALLGVLSRGKHPVRVVGRFVKSIQAWLLSHPRDATVRVAYLGFLQREGSKRAALSALTATKRWLSRNAEDRNVRQAWMTCVEARGNIDHKNAAIEHTKAWLVGHPDASGVCDTLLAWLSREGRNAEGDELVSRAVERNPQDQNLITRKLKSTRAASDKIESRKDHERLIASQPNNPTFKCNYATWLRKNGFCDDAEAIYQELYRLPTAHVAREQSAIDYGFGEILLAQGRFHDAADKFEAVLRRNPKQQMAHDGLARAYWCLGRYWKAEAEFKDAIKCAPRYGSARFYNALGCMYLDRGLVSDAVKAFGRARANSAECLDALPGIQTLLEHANDRERLAELAVVWRSQAPTRDGSDRLNIGDLLRAYSAKLAEQLS